MSIQEDLARNRAAFAALAGGEPALPAVVKQPILPRRDRLPGIAEAAMPPRWGKLPALTEETAPPRPIVYTLGSPPPPAYPGAGAIETELAYPGAQSSRPPGGDDAITDGAYKSLLRRFDTDARREPQPATEEGLL